ncbi:PREDICTED: LOC110806999 isoform [Prunus dulcis]|uniref:PREDICTED: LOC110806999 isoform n=1 Tax=Prunus dulcis TaxID=3755 RepID=A0A5E4EYV4_PRUDU|nr:PREDICTED: LOC110806999 isoform [Prunus dulcis]
MIECSKQIFGCPYKFPRYELKTETKTKKIPTNTYDPIPWQRKGSQMPNCFSSSLVEALTNEEEVELRSKIEALGLEVTKLPSKSTHHLDELEIAKELDKLSAKLDDVDEMISSAMASDPQVKSLLSGTADVWMPVITANADERRNFTSSIADDSPEAKGKSFN